MAEALGTSSVLQLAMAHQLDAIGYEKREESRSLEQFNEELNTWAQTTRAAFPDLVLDVLALRQPSAAFTITNTCGRFLEGLEVEVHIEGSVIQHPKKSAEDIVDSLAERPRKWGPWRQPRLNPFDLGGYVPVPFHGGVRVPRPNSTNFRNSGSVTAVLRCRELRPRRNHAFNTEDDHRDIALLTSDLDLSTARITITATARGVHDTYVAEFMHPVSESVDATNAMTRLVTAHSV